jgi:hypothetical protein
MSKEEVIKRLEYAKSEHGDDCLLCAWKDCRIDEAIQLLESEPEPTVSKETYIRREGEKT